MIGRNQWCEKKKLPLTIFISSGFLAMFRSNAVYDPCVWHTHGALKAHEKQKVSRGLSPLSAALTVCAVPCHDPLLKHPISVGEFNHLWLLTRATYWENTSGAVGAGNLVRGNLQKPSQGPDMQYRNFFSKFSCATKMHKIYLQVTQIPELLKLFVPWHRWNQLQLYWTAFINKSNISLGHFLWNLVDVMPRRKFTL